MVTVVAKERASVRDRDSKGMVMGRGTGGTDETWGKGRLEEGEGMADRCSNA